MINVLIIEDDPMVAKFNALYLESIPGFTVAGITKSAEEGWAFYQTNKVDLILLDVYMGKKTGLELLIDFRRADDPVDVIIITAANDKQSVQTALRNGAVDYLIKPFSFDRFQEALLQYAQKHGVMKDSENVSQEEIDTFLLRSGKQQTPSLELPKGLTGRTLSTIALRIINRERKAFSVADLAGETGISSVSVRKYLNYLVEMKMLSVDVIYQETGRPLNQYLINPKRIDILQMFVKE